MLTTETLQPVVPAEERTTVSHRRSYPALNRKAGSGTHWSSRADAIVEAPAFIQVYISGLSGFGVHGLLRSVSRGGLQVLVPAPVPVRMAVNVTVSGCEAVLGDVFYCVRKNTVYQIGVVLRARPKPETALGGFAVMNELDEPFAASRGHIVDIARDCISVLCKTTLRPEAWVRLETNGWVLFGLVRGVVPTSMVASCVEIHLDAAFRAGSGAAPGIPRNAGETSVMRSSHAF